uniref:Uncharacterized protein n=1 Tax=viral metagenome TaxID=1070528 RepID=A0A6C0J2X4_9ZZZZ
MTPIPKNPKSQKPRPQTPNKWVGGQLHRVPCDAQPLFVHML